MMHNRGKRKVLWAMEKEAMDAARVLEESNLGAEDMRQVNGKKVCVIGGAGFLGSHIVRQLLALECEVTVIDNLSVGKEEFLPTDVRLIEADIRSTGLNGSYDYVMNYAAMPFIPDCYQNPGNALLTNTTAALNLMEAFCDSGAIFLQISSAEVYGNTIPESGYLSEEDVLAPVSTYASTKAAIDQIALARYREVGLPVIVLRQFNCIGERETHPYVVPEIISQVQRAPEYDGGKIEIKLGNNSVRDFMYAGDATWSAIGLLKSGELGEAYNLGSQKSIGIYELAATIADIMKPGVELHIKEDPKKVRPNELWALRSDNSKIEKLIGLRERVNFEDALARTINYFHENGCKWIWE